MAAHSAQTIAVFSALTEHPLEWRHGYDMAKQTGLKSGTLYPILIRLADRGLVDARWEDEQPAGRPRRHLYRLTADGLTAARAALGHKESRVEEASRARRSRRAGLATGGAL